jgi:hypothetical protein
MGFMCSRVQKCLLNSISFSIYIYCSVRNGNQNTFAFALTLYSLHYFNSIFYFAYIKNAQFIYIIFTVILLSRLHV